jgi:hypothetical protein
VCVSSRLKKRAWEMLCGEQTNKKEIIGERPVRRESLLGGSRYIGGVFSCRLGQSRAR